MRWSLRKYFPLGRDISHYPKITALTQVVSVIEEGGLLYKKTYGNKVPVLIIDGADIVAKSNRKFKLFDGLLEWAKVRK